jgi:FeS assembly SUF system protein
MSETTTPGAITPGEIHDQVVQVMRETFDPEIPVNVYELGLVYAIDVTDAREVTVTMTLTSPMCPVAGSLPPEVEAKVRDLPGVASARVNLVWEPPWNQNMMTEAAKLRLGLL